MSFHFCSISSTWRRTLSCNLCAHLLYANICGTVRSHLQWTMLGENKTIIWMKLSFKMIKKYIYRSIWWWKAKEEASSHKQERWIWQNFRSDARIRSPQCSIDITLWIGRIYGRAFRLMMPLRPLLPQATAIDCAKKKKRPKPGETKWKIARTDAW